VKTERDIVLIAVLVGLTSMLHAADSPLPDTAYKKSSAQYHDNGTLMRCKLRKPTKIQGYPCQRWVWFHANGTPKQLELAEATTIQGISIPKKTTVFLGTDGSLGKCWLSKNVTIQGIPCNGGFTKVTTVFHKNGKILCCFLSESAEIQGIPCKASVFKPVYFHPSGKLKTCTLSKKHAQDGKEYEKGTTLHLDEKGNVLPLKTEL
jgi:hypothetical protein